MGKKLAAVLLYSLQHKAMEAIVIADCYRTGQPLPDIIKNAPVLINGLQLFFNAFFDLDTERSHAMGLTLIPRSAMVNYALECGLDEEGTEDLLYLVRKMDLANIEYLASKRPKTNGKSK